MSNMTEVLRMGYKENEMVIRRKKKFVFFFFFLIRAASPFDLQTSMSVSIKPTSLPSLFNEPQPISSPVLDLQAGMCQLHSVESGL